MNLKNDTILTAAFSQPWERPIRIYDDGLGPVWLFGDETGVCMVIRALSFDKAWEIMLDESPAIEVDELPEAYGFYGDDAQAQLEEAEKLLREGEILIDDFPDLVEGYAHQPNTTGTGIVSVSHNAWMRQYDPEHDRQRVRLVIRHTETA